MRRGSDIVIVQRPVGLSVQYLLDGMPRTFLVRLKSFSTQDMLTLSDNAPKPDMELDAVQIRELAAFSRKNLACDICVRSSDAYIEFGCIHSTLRFGSEKMDAFAPRFVKGDLSPMLKALTRVPFTKLGITVVPNGPLILRFSSPWGYLNVLVARPQ